MIQNELENGQIKLDLSIYSLNLMDRQKMVI